MLKIRVLILFVFSACIFYIVNDQNLSAQGLEDQRPEQIINSQWTFNYFPGETADDGYESPGFDDSAWPVVSIPHTWNTYETTGELHPFIGNASESDNPYWWIGWGWYRKHFKIERDIADRKVFIQFDGVQKYCKIWINGNYLGDHKGGYGAFDFDLTPYLKRNGDNVIAVAVNNLQNDKYNIPPMVPGNFDIYGGIYRDVTLKLCNNVYIPMQGSASHEGGTFITTPSVSEKEGIARIKTWVKNDGKESKGCTLQTTLYEASGKIIQIVRNTETIAPGDIYEYDQLLRPVRKPNLWSPDSPYLYTVSSEVMIDRKVVDRYISKFGFRWYSWDYKDNSLLLNGNKINLHGGGYIGEYPWIGGAVSKWITEKDISDLSGKLNFNFLRTSYYPGNKDVYDLADKYGLVVVEESPCINNQAFGTDIQELQTKEMVRRDRNHPCIIFWSIGNNSDHAVNSKIVEAEDNTRIIASQSVTGSSLGDLVKITEKNMSFDSLSCRAIRGWIASDDPGEDSLSYRSCIPENYQPQCMMARGFKLTDNQCIRAYEDYGSGQIFRNSTLQHVDPSGLIDMYRVPKYAYYFWQANFTDKPMVFTEPHYWQSKYLGQKRDIVVYSNCDKVELMVDGNILASKVPNDANMHRVIFKDITISKGILSATGTKKGNSITDKVFMEGEPARVRVSSSHSKFPADRASIAIITADITDSSDNHVRGADNIVKWEITGPGTLVGPPVYESEIDKTNKIEGIGYIGMPVSNVIRSTGKPGIIHVTVYSSGLASGAVDIEALEVSPDTSFLSEPLLDAEGRNEVDRLVIKSDRVEETRREIKISSENIDFGKGGIKEYSQKIREYLLINNPSVDSSSIELKALVNIMTRQLLNNKGRISFDDYNYNVDHFNKCRLILSYISSTKLPDPFKEGLRKYYAEAVIKNGSEKDAGDEMNWLNWIPSGGTVVYSVLNTNESYPKGTKTSKSNDLTELIALVYPVYKTFSDVAKQRALTFISKMNPYVVQVKATGQIDDRHDNQTNKPVFRAERNKPILIPELKFLAE